MPLLAVPELIVHFHIARPLPMYARRRGRRRRRQALCLTPRIAEKRCFLLRSGRWRCGGRAGSAPENYVSRATYRALPVCPPCARLT